MSKTYHSKKRKRNNTNCSFSTHVCKLNQNDDTTPVVFLEKYDWNVMMQKVHVVINWIKSVFLVLGFYCHLTALMQPKVDIIADFPIGSFSFSPFVSITWKPNVHIFNFPFHEDPRQFSAMLRSFIDLQILFSVVQSQLLIA